MLILSYEKQLLESYREAASSIVDRHISMLRSLSPKAAKGSTQEFLKAFSQHLKVINAELAAYAEKIMEDAQASTALDRKKLNEHLFIIRKDCFNDFLKKSELCL